MKFVKTFKEVQGFMSFSTINSQQFASYDPGIDLL